MPQKRQWMQHTNFYKLKMTIDMKKIFGLIALAAISFSGWSQSTPIQDEQLQQLIQQAVSNYSKVKELEIMYRSNDVNDEMIKSNWLPEVSADAGYRFNAPSPSIDFPTASGPKAFQFTPYNNYNAELTVNQLLYDFGKTRAQLQKSNAERKLSQDNIDLLKNTIGYQVAEIYFSIGFLENAIKVQNSQISSLRENERLIDAKVRNGDALEYDLLTTRVRIANSSNRLADLQSQLERQYIMLRMYTGAEQKGKINSNLVRTDLPMAIDPESTDWQSTSLEVQNIKHRLQGLDVDYKNASLMNRPSVFGQAGGGVRNGFQPEIDRMRLNGTVGVGISIPIFSGNRPQLQRKMTQINMDAAKQSLQTLEENVRKDLANVNEDYKNLQVKLDNTKLLVQQAQKAYDLAQVRFKNGLITSAELVAAQSNIEDARLTQIQLEYQELLDKLQSQKIVGNRIW
jgi:outer membrane protein